LQEIWRKTDRITRIIAREMKSSYTGKDIYTSPSILWNDR